MKRISLAIIGSRGIPAKYGGFETFSEELSTGLVEKGFDVYVSCEGEISPKIYSYKGVNLFYFPIKPFIRVIYETIYDVYSLIKSCLMCDYIYVLGYGAGIFFFIPKIFKKKILVNVDGIEWKRDKYNVIEKVILYISEFFAVNFADIIIADSIEIKKYIKSAHGKNAIYISYGVDIPNNETWNSLKLAEIDPEDKYSTLLEKNNYYLVVSRLEPENNIHVTVEGFLLGDTDKILVIVGNFLNKKYRIKIEKIIQQYNANNRVIFTGAIYRKDILNMLRQNCFAYFHGHSAGGTNPSLLEIMALKKIIITYDCKFNKEVGKDSMIYFHDSKNIADIINDTMKYNTYEIENLKEKAFREVISNYSWNKVIEEYDRLIRKL